MVAGLLLLAGAFGVWRSVSSVGGPTSVQQQTQGGGALGGDASSIASDVSPAVVSINTYQRTFEPDPFGGSGGVVAPLGAGTGMILTPSGEVLTNNHVIEGSTTIRVRIPGRSDAYTAMVLGVDPGDDVALLQIEGVSGLPTVTLGDPSELSVGDEVVAIGNALGRGSPTATSGTVADLHRSIVARDPGGAAERLDDLIQTDATIQPGDSGGPLVNTDGEVVGMITAGSTSDGSARATDVGFAIPTDDALAVVTQIRSGEEGNGVLLGERGFLGVAVQALTEAATADLGFEASSGVLVIDTQPGSPAESAGILVPAVIVEIDGQAIGSPEELGNAIHAHLPGETMQVTWIDGSGTHTETVSLISGPAV
jgi:S1-C subfamily serine protease